MNLDDSLSGVVAERDFYRRLLDLGGASDIEPLLDEALALIVAVTGAKIAYLELYDEEGATRGSGRRTRWPTPRSLRSGAQCPPLSCSEESQGGIAM